MILRTQAPEREFRQMQSVLPSALASNPSSMLTSLQLASPPMASDEAVVAPFISHMTLAPLVESRHTRSVLRSLL